MRFVLFTLCTLLLAPAQAQSPYEWQWSRQLGGTGVDAATDIAVDNAGNTFIVGHFQNSIDMGGTTLTSAGAADGYVAKYDASGALLWASLLSSVEDVRVVGISIDCSGYIYITGTYLGTLTYGASSLVAQASVRDFFSDSVGYRWQLALGQNLHRHGLPHRAFCHPCRMWGGRYCRRLHFSG
ncbi:MAG: hypothetical protein HC842_07535 [Cytophagales bacterium]|nr:hypothetical protein [Cytophagales bacterium]